MNIKNILITGSSGFIGGKVIKRLIEDGSYYIFALASSAERINEMLVRENIKCCDAITSVSNLEFLSPEYIPSEIYGVLHLAFSRRNRTETEIARSIDFAYKIYEKLAKYKVPKVINLSSQSVYGNTKDFRTEDTPVAPNSLYSFAKYASEKIFDACYSNIHVDKTNVRLDSVIQSQNLVQTLFKQAIEKGVISLKGGKQRFSYIDYHDVAEAILALLKTSCRWKPIYNVGLNRKRYTLIEIAELVRSVTRKYGYKIPSIEIKKQDILIWAGMDSSLFSNDTGWNPKYDIEKMVERIFWGLYSE